MRCVLHLETSPFLHHLPRHAEPVVQDRAVTWRVAVFSTVLIRVSACIEQCVHLPVTPYLHATNSGVSPSSGRPSTCDDGMLRDEDTSQVPVCRRTHVHTRIRHLRLSWCLQGRRSHRNSSLAEQTEVGDAHVCEQCLAATWLLKSESCWFSGATRVSTRTQPMRKSSQQGIRPKGIQGNRGVRYSIRRV